VGVDYHGGSGVGSSDADVVRWCVGAQGDAVGVLDSVLSRSFVGVGVSGVGGCRFRHALVDHRGRCSVSQQPVGAVVVVVIGELLEQLLQFGDCARLRVRGP